MQMKPPCLNLEDICEERISFSERKAMWKQSVRGTHNCGTQAAAHKDIFSKEKLCVCE